MKKIYLSVLFSTALFGLTNQAAQASVAAASTTYSVKFRVVDLTPDDGIAAGFTTALSYANGGVWLGERWFGNTWFTDSIHNSPIQNDSVAMQYQNASASAVTGPTAGAAVTDFGPGPIEGEASAYSDVFWQLKLAPNTALVVSGRYDITIDRNPGNQEWTFVNANGRIEISADAGESRFYKSADYGNYSFQTGSTGSYYSFSLANTGTMDMDANIYLSAVSNARAYPNSIPAVPEPSAWLMLGAGLAIAGVTARRRQRSA